MVFLGNPGIGKTHLCAALFNYIRHFNKRYWSEGDLIRAIVGDHNTYGGDYFDHLMYKIDYHFLIIDDIGSTSYQEWKEDLFFQILDKRMASMLPTVFTSNISRSGFGENFEARVTSRLFSSENLIIEVTGTDQRLN